MGDIHRLYAATDIKLAAVTYEDCYEYFKDTELFSADDYNKRLDTFKSELAYNSNLISGMRVDYYVTKAVMHDDDIPGYIGRFSSLVAVNNFELLFNKMWGDLLKGRQVGLGMVNDYHSLLMRGLLDEDGYRKENYPCEHLEDIVEEKDIVRILQDSLGYAKYSAKDSTDDVITKAIEVAISVERIRPFVDGNGRLARVLLNYILLLNGLPPAIIYGIDSKRYFKMVKEYSKGSKAEWISFIKHCTILTWEKKVSGGN